MSRPSRKNRVTVAQGINLLTRLTSSPRIITLFFSIFSFSCFRSSFFNRQATNFFKNWQTGNWSIMIFRQIGIGVAWGVRRVVKNLSIQNFMEYLYATIAVFSDDWSFTTHDRCIENAHRTCDRTHRTFGLSTRVHHPTSKIRVSYFPWIASQLDWRVNLLTRLSLRLMKNRQPCQWLVVP